MSDKAIEITARLQQQADAISERHRRQTCLAQARSAWQRMTDEQRAEFLREVFGVSQGTES